ncbi:MAG TPA: hypothetical protein VLY63_00520, partial [Anaerolineae bacterium]|nr:hypothetical protein [Anaerolineae bacterium]
LAPTLHGQPLRITLQSEGARFSAQVWKLRAGERGPFALTQRPEPMEGAGGGLYTQTIPCLDTAEADRLALIITRLDAGERTDPTGKYYLTLDSSSDIVAAAEDVLDISDSLLRPDP